MDQQREQASQNAHEFIVYQKSEQADIDAKDHQFDALWQSIYDVCKLIKFGIIEDITEEAVFDIKLNFFKKKYKKGLIY